MAVVWIWGAQSLLLNTVFLKFFSRRRFLGELFTECEVTVLMSIKDVFMALWIYIFTCSQSVLLNSSFEWKYEALWHVGALLQCCEVMEDLSLLLGLRNVFPFVHYLSKITTKKFVILPECSIGDSLRSVLDVAFCSSCEGFVGGM